MQRQIPPGRAFSCTPPTLALNLAALSVTCNLRKWKRLLVAHSSRFWLEWGRSHLPNSVIPTGTDHRKAMICEVEGPGVLFWGDEWLRSGRMERHENANERLEDFVQL